MSRAEKYTYRYNYVYKYLGRFREYAEICNEARADRIKSSFDVHVSRFSRSRISDGRVYVKTRVPWSSGQVYEYNYRVEALPEYREPSIRNVTSIKL